MAGMGIAVAELVTTPDSDRNSALLVQTARSVEFVDGRLILHGISPSTLYLSNRSERVVGHIDTADLVASWLRENSRFAKEPPAAALSFVGPASAGCDDVVVRIHSPRLDQQSLVYSVSILEGHLVRHSGPCSLFIDALGRPVSPVSFTASLRLTRDRNRWAARQPDFLESLASL